MAIALEAIGEMTNQCNNDLIDKKIQELIPQAQTNVEACILLASIYLQNKQNITMALYWLEQSYDLGYKKVALEIANMYYPENNIMPDEELAYEWYMKGSADGIPECSFILANLFRTGNLSLPKNGMKALEFYELSGKQGFAQGFEYAAIGYIKGELVPQNFVYAEKLLRTSYEMGNTSALKGLQYLEIMKSHSKGVAKREKNQSRYTPTLYDSGFTGLAEIEERYEQQRSAENEARREMLYAAAAVNPDTQFSYMDIDAGVVFNENMEMVSHVDTNTGMIFGRDGIAFHDKNTHTTYSPEKGFTHYDPKSKTSYNYGEGELTFHNGDISINYKKD